MGTPGYIAPEVRRGDSATPASDQFSFCVSLFEAIYGRRPDQVAPAGGVTQSTISGPNGAHTAAQPTAAATASPPADRPPPELLELLRRGLEPDAVARHPSMASAIEALDRLSGGGPEADTHAERHARVVILGLILLLSMAIATMIIWRGHGRTLGTARDAFLFALAPSSIILIGLFATRRALGRSQLNRQFRAIVALTVLAFLGHRALAIRWTTPVASLLAGDAYLLGVIVAVAAVSLERWMALMAAMLFAGALVATWWPPHAEAAFGAATFVGIAFAALHWKPSRRPFFYRARVRMLRRLRSLRR
jgi:serine/threonine-protein kinase